MKGGFFEGIRGDGGRFFGGLVGGGARGRWAESVVVLGIYNVICWGFVGTPGYGRISQY